MAKETDEDRGHTTRLTIYLTDHLTRGLRLAAADKGVSQSEVVAQALSRSFRHDPPPGFAVASLEAIDRPSYADGVLQARGLRRRGVDYARICVILNREGFRTQRGRLWTKASVGRMLRTASLRRALGQPTATAKS